MPGIGWLGRRGEFQRLSTKLACLSGAAQTFGAEALSQVVQRMTRANASNDTCAILSLFPEMEEATAEVKEAVRRLCRQFGLASAKK